MARVHADWLPAACPRYAITLPSISVAALCQGDLESIALPLEGVLAMSHHAVRRLWPQGAAAFQGAILHMRPPPFDFARCYDLARELRGLLPHPEDPEERATLDATIGSLQEASDSQSRIDMDSDRVRLIECILLSEQLRNSHSLYTTC